MFTKTKRRLVVLATGAALLVGAGAAYAAGQAGPPQSPAGAGQAAGAGYGVTAGGVVIDAAAAYIGISEDALVAARHDGKSLAQIAVANGKTAAGLKQALVAAFKENLEDAVAAKRITSAQASQALTTFESRVQAVVDRTATGPMNGRGAGIGPRDGSGPAYGNGPGNGQGRGFGPGDGSCRATS